MIFKKIKKDFKKQKNKFFPSRYRKNRYYYAEHYESEPIDENLILYETRDGKTIVDSPYAMFLELATNPKYQSFKHVWVINPEIPGIKNTIPDNLRDKVLFVERGSIENIDAMLRAKYLITNSTFESYFVKREGQIYINTWHGTPLKFMGFDIPGFVNHSQNVLRNFLMADFILSPNSHTSQIFIDGYKLKGIYPGKILEGGYPRIDLTLNSNSEIVKEKLILSGLKVTDKPIILFCPTWKGTSITNTDDDVNQLVKETLMLVEKFKEQYDVLIKVHPYVYNKAKEEEEISDYLISDLFDPNEILSITDVLITDYSSIFFDFLVTKKPIVFYSWDKDLYQENRGMYLLEEELPGPICENLDDLISCIENISENKKLFEERYEVLAQKMVSYEDGEVTKKYIEYIFSGQKSEQIKELNVDSNKKKILIYPGGMVNNGITTSFLNLVNNINYEEYDVTVMVNSNRNVEVNKNIKLLNKNARPMFRFGGHILTKKEVKVNDVFNVEGMKPEERKDYPEVGYKREMNRLTANLEFDVAIDFSGYSYFWARHILSANAKKYIAFMHNDLKADSEKVINNMQPRKKDLQSLFTVYYKFDRLLSVSPMTRDVNLEKLNDFVTVEQMGYVYNSINIDQILHSTDTQLETKKSPIYLIKRLNLVRETTETVYYKNIEEIETQTSHSIKLNKDDKVVQHATFVFKETIFSKVTIEGVYVGWIDVEYFTPRLLDVNDFTKFHAYGTVSKALQFPIWKEIRTNSESDQIVAYARHFKNRYLEVTHEAYTENGRYLLVHYNGERIGWMSSKPLARIHKVDPLKLLHIHFSKKMREMEEKSPIMYSQKVENRLELFAKLKRDQDVSIWRDPSPVIGSVELPISDDYYEAAFKINQKIYFSEHTYCRLMLEDGSFVGFIDQDMLEMIDEKEFFEMNHDDSQEYGLSILPKMDLAMQKVPKFDKTYINFVNMGRLSPEKNQEQLISAFKKFNDEVPNSRLYILGKGPLSGDLVKHIRDLNLEGKAILLGHIATPFEFMRLNDYFVLPSFYEGQPMVLLESMTIGMKILASNIPANINVVGKDEKYGLLTEGTDVEDIYNGLKCAYEFKDQFAEFDYHAYNQDAIDNFYREIN